MLGRALRPGFVDLIFAALMAWIFVLSPKGWSVLLGDGDTGWHIRTGQWILTNHQVPYRDLFSFSKPDAPWFAWEWGADVLFALLYSAGGLALLVFFSGFVLVASSIILLRWMIWRGSSVLVAFPVMMLAVGGSTVHYLARPHIFTLLFLAIELWLLDSERRNPSRRIWLLVPLALLWANLHGGWPALFVFLGIQIAAHLVYGDPVWKKELLVALSCGAATLVNPYGWQLHQHIFGYLQSSWIRDSIEEFQSPKFRSENVLQFEILLIAGIAASWGRAFRGASGLAEAVSVWLWAHFALGAVRHAPLFILAASPVIASELSLAMESLWAGVKKSSVLGIFRDLDLDLRPKFASNSLWALVFPLILCLLTQQKLPSDFPEKRFPVAAVNSLAAQLNGRRILTSDQWGDYLIYRRWPDLKIFIDGRSDFFGPALGQDYLDLLNVGPKWRDHLVRYQIDTVLLPVDASLAARLASEPGWQLLHSDTVSVAYARNSTIAGIPHSQHLFSPPD
ncbi:MAG: hypothetical protein NTW74_05920 [Acidobacteria bacterium]|nr:hypothetical protein [Acidobacteriota bacterium]